ncbi:MAG: hypothetical protein K0S25_7 [Bacillus sp. (in: firmicutes)]|jgi:hypothetical protein|nr:hypothetical protein [Bacillus sp. (in: firmicutes)]
MKSSLFPLQETLFQRLTNDSMLIAKNIKTYDDVPSSPSFPYISLGDDTVNNWSTKTSKGEEITHTLHVWSRYNGKKEAKEIMDLVLQSITSTPLSIGSGFSMDFSRMEFMEVITDPDGITRHGIMRLRFKISQ